MFVFAVEKKTYRAETQWWFWEDGGQEGSITVWPPHHDAAWNQCCFNYGFYAFC